MVCCYTLRPIMCPTRMLRRGVKANVTYALTPVPSGKLKD
jgi:hypothetical protein